MGDDGGIEPQFGLPSYEAQRLTNLTVYWWEDIEEAFMYLAPRMSAEEATAWVLAASNIHHWSPDEMRRRAQQATPPRPDEMR